MVNTLLDTRRGSSFNSSFIPSPADLLLAIPRFVSFTFTYLPEQLDDLFALAKSPGRTIPDATTKAAASNTSLKTSGTTFAKSAAASAAAQSIPSSPLANSNFFSRVTRAVSFSHGVSNMDGIFSYLASRWAVSTFLVAVVLNRAHVYASSRRRLRLNWRTRLLLRIIPILLFLHQVERVLQVMRCQTGPLLANSPSPGSDDNLNILFTNEGGFLHNLSSALLFWQSEENSCRASGMMRMEDPTSALGSSAVLWPLFLCLCFSHFVETISCALRGRQPMAETGMTIFEHSLAFAEAEAVVRSSLGLKLFGASKDSKVSEEGLSSLAALGRTVMMQNLNVPPEVLLIALISSLSHLTSHVLGVFHLQSRCRLVTTFIWGTAFMSAFLWGFIKFSRADANPNLAVIRYPTVCIVGFIPHFMVIVGTSICCSIYSIALILNLICPPASQMAGGTFRERIRMAQNNLQASTALSSIRISWRDEFYTTLMKVGFSVLTAASEAVYFNEGTHVSIGARTWLEEKRYSEALSKSLAKKQKIYAAMIPPEIQGSQVAEGLSMVDELPNVPSDITMSRASGFARERKAANLSTKMGTAAVRGEGVGRSQSNGRLHLSLLLFREIAQLVVCACAKTSMALFNLAGVNWSPEWLKSLARSGQEQPKKTKTALETIPFWMVSEDGSLQIPHDTNVDVEIETRKRLSEGEEVFESEDDIDRHLYKWWRSGGFWGDLDGSGEYSPSMADDEDVTSVITTAVGSDSDVGSVSELGTDLDSMSEEDGQQTPTQRDVREATPTLRQETLNQMSRLLNPKTLEDRQEARLLARRLQSSGPVTRSEYKRFEAMDRLQLLQSSAEHSSKDLHRMTAEEEEELLEQLVRTRRQQKPTNTSEFGYSSKPGNSSRDDTAGQGTSWTEGAEGMGSEGPQCVVCRSCPRTILVWPCRCLCLCEDCRVSLAMNNFANCICCRREVVAFSRLFVP